MDLTYRSSKQAKAAFVQSVLDTVHPNPPVPLQHSDPFTLLVAVLLSAQTTDVAVNQATPALFAKAHTPQAMAALSEAEILSYIRRLGLAPTKARHLKAMAQILAEKFGGVVPQNLEDLESLPGVGHKTASVVLSHAFKIPAFPVDTHIHRLAWRWGLSDGTSVANTEKHLKSLFAKERWELLHLQIIYFGRSHCPARGHVPEHCPICSVIGHPERV